MKKILILVLALIVISNAFGVGYSLYVNRYQAKGNDTIPVYATQQESRLNSSAAKNAAVTIYPNPTGSDKLVVKAENEIYAVEILNALGQIVLKQKISTPSKEINLTIPDIRTGIYLTRIHFKERIIVKKLLVR